MSNSMFHVLQVSKDIVRPYVPLLLDALHICFKDDSWPVRDGKDMLFEPTCATCMAGSYANAFCLSACLFEIFRLDNNEV